jgi:hypothetical protein
MALTRRTAHDRVNCAAAAAAADTQRALNVSLLFLATISHAAAAATAAAESADVPTRYRARDSPREGGRVGGWVGEDGESAAGVTRRC